MINRLNFRMGSGLSIPIYADWIKIKSIDVEHDGLVISAVNGVPVHPSIFFDELDLVSVIYAQQDIWFSSIDQNLERWNNAMEFDLYQKFAKIGHVDVLQLRDLDRWRYTTGIPVELLFSVKILADNSGSIGLDIIAKDNISLALLKRMGYIVGGSMKIASTDDVRVDQMVNLEKINNGIILYEGNGVDFSNVSQAISGIFNAFDIDFERRYVYIKQFDAEHMGDLGGYRYEKGIPIEFLFDVNILADDSGHISMEMKAKNEMGYELIRHTNVSSDKIVISNSSTPTIPNIAMGINHILPDNVTEGLELDSSTIDFGDVENGVMHITGGNNLTLDSINSAFSSIGENNLELDGDVDVRMEASIIQDDDGKVCLVLHAKDDVEVDVDETS